MSHSPEAVPSPGLRSASEIPRIGLAKMLREVVLGGENERIDMRSRLDKQYREHGAVVMQDLGLMRMVNLFGPDANRLVLLDRDRIFSARKPWTQIMGRIFPNGLLLMDGEQHKHNRKIMHMAFKRPALREYAETMNPMIERALDSWRHEDGTIHAFSAIKDLTLDMAARIFVGVELGPETRKLNQTFEDLVAASMSRVRLPIPGLEFHRGLQGRKFMVEYFRKLIPERRSGEGADMVSRLCRAVTEEGGRFDDQQITDHMVFLMMAAHDTTTSTLSSMIYELARNPEWQERVRAESRELGSPRLGFDQLEELESLTWVMKETLRRYPPLPVIPRVALEDFEFKGFLIPARSMVVISPIHTHHLEEWWPDPFRFDPERFSPERAEHERHSHAWVPFGGGPHMCLGFRFAELQTKAVIHQLVQHYRWSVPSDYTMPVQQAPISKPMDGLPIRLEAL